MDDRKKTSFAPIYNKESQVLILGSFPSVKSRKIEFYYGNKQNRFWRMLCGYFNEEIPVDTKGKTEFLFRNKIALWDMAVSCEVQGSADASVKNAELADLSEVLNKADIQRILLNGTLAYDLFCQKYADIDIPYVKMPSTSPANPRFDEKIWRKQLDEVFGEK
ncbi:MAG: DNA-deoxyinosine glycosylase [Clostridia bacterium]|nr:DNA-deoxyinosine glycosylase [Clostridia bacterium]